mmetsp:Transcript_21259/g.57212  ORF Transcript_21259/g.57212 Transcript_21259/m.57212 type:complete len:234 (+) Transcript_21259:78-779(+)
MVRGGSGGGAPVCTPQNPYTNDNRGVGRHAAPGLSGEEASGRTNFPYDKTRRAPAQTLCLWCRVDVALARARGIPVVSISPVLARPELSRASFALLVDGVIDGGPPEHSLVVGRQTISFLRHVLRNIVQYLLVAAEEWGHIPVRERLAFAVQLFEPTLGHEALDLILRSAHSPGVCQERVVARIESGPAPNGLGLGLLQFLDLVKPRLGEPPCEVRRTRSEGRQSGHQERHVF